MSSKNVQATIQNKLISFIIPSNKNVKCFICANKLLVRIIVVE